MCPLRNRTSIRHWNLPTLKLLGCYMFKDRTIYVLCLFSDLIDEKNKFLFNRSFLSMRCWSSNFIVSKVVGHN